MSRNLTRSRAQLTHTDHANLRGVCKDLGGAMQRLFFSTLVLRTGGELQCDNGVQKIKALATGKTGWSSHAKTLCIKPAARAVEELDISANEMQELLAAALRSIVNIRTVM